MVINIFSNFKGKRFFFFLIIFDRFYVLLEFFVCVFVIYWEDFLWGDWKIFSLVRGFLVYLIFFDILSDWFVCYFCFILLY